MGFHTAAIARGTDKEPRARKLGAKEYIASTKHNVAEAMTKLGAAGVILATLTDAKSMSDAMGASG